MRGTKTLLSTAIIVVLAAAGLVSATGASAAPHCTVPEPPPACGPAPSPTTPPTPAGSLTSEPIAVAVDGPNTFHIDVLGLDPTLLSAYHDQDLTRFALSLSCSNGYVTSVPMRARIDPDESPFLRANLTAVVSTPTGSAAGMCYVTTWDKSRLHLTRTTLGRDGGGPATWWVAFF